MKHPRASRPKWAVAVSVLVAALVTVLLATWSPSTVNAFEGVMTSVSITGSPVPESGRVDQHAEVVWNVSVTWSGDEAEGSTSEIVYLVDGEAVASWEGGFPQHVEDVTLRTYDLGPATHSVEVSSNGWLVHSKSTTLDVQRPTQEPSPPSEPTPVPDAERTTVTAKWPKARNVKYGTTRRVTGKVTGKAKGRRTVELQHRHRHGWDTLATVKARRNGRYALTIPTSWYAKHRLRVRVHATTTHAAATSKNVKRLNVTAPYRPSGKAGQHSLLSGRWDPCQPIRYRINPKGIPSRVSVADLHEGVRLVSQATGLRFVYSGRTKVVPLATKRKDGTYPRGYPKDPRADFLIGFATPKQVPGLRHHTGLGGFETRSTSTEPQAIYGSVVFSRVGTIKHLGSGWGEGATWGHLILHEIAHGVGLGHVGNVPQIMNGDVIGRGVDRFGRGDLAGLAKVGRSAGCIKDATQLTDR